ncbi:MAG: hypothetical protein J6S73_08385 [Lentisphaeria bacterium]|nr:hypothetical protein [Lentisphaeria bacterium]
MFTDPNDFTGSDIEKINQAVRKAAETGVPVRIGKRRTGDGRNFWLLDSAILVPSNAVLIFENCRVKLSDRCRDNFIRSANCVPGGEFVPAAENIHISGVGSVVFEGADDPRSTGDSGKQNMPGTCDYVSSYGSDGVPPDAHATWGDWRNIGILLVRTKHFSIEGITICHSHCWGISLEYCTHGTVRDITFDSTGICTVNGKQETIRNQDGLDLRRGCKNIVIENIRGRTGDDLIALTALGGRIRPAGAEKTTEYCGMQSGDGVNDTCFIMIRNVQGYSAGGHHIVRFLNNGGVKIHHIQLENVMDTSPADFHCKAAVKIGDTNYGGLAVPGETSGFQITNIQSNARHALLLAGPLTDSVISNVINFFDNAEIITMEAKGEGSYKGVSVTNFIG